MARKRAVLRLLASAVAHSAVVWCAHPSCWSLSASRADSMLPFYALSALLYVAGLAGILAAPLLARNTFTDENALLVGPCLACPLRRPPC